MHIQSSTSIVSCLRNGFRLIWQPGIRLYAIIPIVINCLLFLGFYALAISYFKDFNHWFYSYIPSWLQWLSKLIFSLSLILITAYTFTFAANLIAAPFNGLLAEQVELKLTGRPATQAANQLAIIKDIPRSIARQLRYLSYFLPRTLLILILLVIPGLQLIAGPLWFIFNSWLSALQYLDYPMDNHRVSFSEMKKRLKEQATTSLSFGAYVALLSSVPLLNVLLIPAATAAATQLWLERFNSK